MSPKINAKSETSKPKFPGKTQGWQHCYGQTPLKVRAQVL